MDRDEVPVNCEQVHKGIWRQAKQDEGGLEAHVISPMLHLCLTSSCLSLQCLARRAMTNCNGECCTMHLGTQSGSKIMKTPKEMTCFRDSPLFAIIAMRSCGNQDARSALRPCLTIGYVPWLCTACQALGAAPPTLSAKSSELFSPTVHSPSQGK